MTHNTIKVISRTYGYKSAQPGTPIRCYFHLFLYTVIHYSYISIIPDCYFISSVFCKMLISSDAIC